MLDVGWFSPDPNRDPDWAKTRWTQWKESYKSRTFSSKIFAYYN